MKRGSLSLESMDTQWEITFEGFGTLLCNLPFCYSLVDTIICFLRNMYWLFIPEMLVKERTKYRAGQGSFPQMQRERKKEKIEECKPLTKENSRKHDIKTLPIVEESNRVNPVEQQSGFPLSLEWLYPE